MDELIEKALNGDISALLDLFLYVGVNETTVPDSATRDKLESLFSSLFVCLTEREQTILKCFFGIGCEKKTLEEIGEDLDFTRDRIRQIKEKATRKIKSYSPYAANPEEWERIKAEQTAVMEKRMRETHEERKLRIEQMLARRAEWEAQRQK